MMMPAIYAVYALQTWVSNGRPTVIFHVPGIETIVVPIPAPFASDVEVSNVVMALAYKPVLGGLGVY